MDLAGRAADDVEVPLVGGNTSAGVVRVGDTVRRPATVASATVHAFLEHLHDVGFDGAPRSLGVDAQGRHVIEHVPGEVLMPFLPADPLGALRRVGRLLRDLHDASASWTPPDDAVWDVVIAPDRTDLVVHHDAAPWNLVVGERWVLIDWDGAGPGSRLWDLAYAAHGFARLAPETPVQESARLIAALADGYQLDGDGRRGLADLLVPRTWSMHALLRQGHEEGRQPWARLWKEGHGLVWQSHAEHTARHADALRAALLDDGGAPA